MCVRYAKLATAADIVCVMYQKLNNNKTLAMFFSFTHEGYEVSVCLQKNEGAWKGCTQ